VIIASGLFSKRVKSLNRKTISELSLSERSDGSGTISFAAQHPMASLFGGMSAWPGAEQFFGPCFDLVPNARTIYESIRNAQASAQ
jgi:hypothetical protein